MCRLHRSAGVYPASPEPHPSLLMITFPQLLGLQLSALIHASRVNAVVGFNAAWLGMET
ncbi:MAG: hypothetical protein IPP17_14835 [Bacteroidetes bacterium]|nr:hypothetical protein [Bacteroidota bacterium]